MISVLIPIAARVGSALKVPALAVFLGQLAANVLGWLAAKMTRSLAINVTIIAMIIAVAALTALGIKSLAMGLSYVLPSYLSTAFSYFVPNNAIPCASTVIAARVARWVWSWQYFAITKVVS